MSQIEISQTVEESAPTNVPVQEPFVGPRQPQSIAEQLLAEPSIAALTQDQREGMLDKLIDQAYDSTKFSRGQLKTASENAMRIKYDMALAKRELDITKLPSQRFYGFSDMDATEQLDDYYMTQEEWDTLTPSARFNLYKTHMDSYGSDTLKMLGHRLEDIRVAATTGTTYGKLVGITADAVKGFVANLPEYITRNALASAETELVNSGIASDEQFVQFKTYSEKALQESEARSEATWKGITEDSFAEWEAYKATNPYGIDFVKNRVLDVAVSVPFGIYGASVRAGLGATAMQVGRAAVAPVVSSAAQGVAFDWSFDKINEALQEEPDWEGMSEEQKTGMRLFALGVSLVATLPVDTRVQSLIKGKTGAEVMQSVVKDVQGRHDLISKINLIIAEAEKEGKDIVAAMAFSPDVSKGIQKAFIRAGVAPADFQLETVVEALNVASNRMAGLKAGTLTDIDPLDDALSGQIKATNIGNTPMPVQARIASEQGAAERASIVAKIEEVAPQLEQDAARARVQGMEDLALAKEAEVQQLEEEALRNAVTSDTVKARTATQIQKEAQATIDPEVKRTLIAEWARVATPMERWEALAQYDRAERAVIQNIEKLGVEVDIPLLPGSNQYLSPYPSGRGTVGSADYVPPWKYTPTRKMSKDEIRHLDALIARHHKIAYDRAPIRTYKDYKQAAGQGNYIPGQQGSRPTHEAAVAQDRALIEGAKNIKQTQDAPKIAASVESEIAAYKAQLKELSNEWKAVREAENRVGTNATHDSIATFFARRNDIRTRVEEIKSRIRELQDGAASSEASLAAAPKTELKVLELPTPQELAPITSEAQIAEAAAIPLPGQKLLSRAVQKRWEKRLGRPLTPEEIVVSNRKARKLAEQMQKEAENAPIFSHWETGETVFSVAALERKFPTLKGSLSNAMEELASDRVLWRDGLVTQEAVLQYMKNIWRTVNLNNMPGWYEKMRPMIEAADQMWDFVRSISQQAPKTNALDDFFNGIRAQAKGVGITEANIKAAREQIERMFPNFDATIRFDPGIRGAGQFDEVTRSIILNPEKLNPRTLMHELGHYYFTHVLTSGERLGFLDGLRPAIANSKVFAETFPEIAGQMSRADAAAGEIGSRGAQFIAYKLDPAELFAESWIHFLSSGRVPSMSTLDAMSTLFKGMANFNKQSEASWSKLPAPVKKLMSYLSIGPSPDQLARMLDDKRTAYREAIVAKFVVDGDVQGRIDELQNLLTMKYGGVEIGGGDMAANLTPSSRSRVFSGERQAALEKGLSESGEAIVYGEGTSPAFWTLSPEEQVALLSRDMEDLLQYAEMHSLRMIQGDLASIDAAETAYRALDQQFGGAKIAERNLRNMQAATDRFMLHQEKFEWDYKIGEEVDQSAAFSEARMAAERLEFTKYQEHAIRANEYANQKVAEAIEERKREAVLRNNETKLSGQRLAWELADLKDAMMNMSGARLAVAQKKVDEIEEALNNLRTRYSAEQSKARKVIQPVSLTQKEINNIRKEAYAEFNEGMEVSNTVELAAQLADKKVPNQLIPGGKEAWAAEFYKQAGYLNKGLSGNEMVTADIRLNEAARLGEYVMLKQMHNHAKAELGLLDFADASWFKRQNAAEHLVDQWWDTTLKGQIANQIFSKPISKSIRYVGALSLGWDQDEEGNWIFNPQMAAEAVAASPYLAFFFPGSRFLLKQTMKGGSGLVKAVMKTQTLKVQEAALRNWEAFKFNWGEYRGSKPLEFMRRAALRTSGTIRQEASDLGGQITSMFPVDRKSAAKIVAKRYPKGTPKDALKEEIKILIAINRGIRSDIMKVVENTEEGREIAARWAKERPDLTAVADKVYDFYRKQTDYLIQKGAILPTDHVYFNKVFESATSGKLSDVLFRGAKLRGMRLPHLADGSVPFDVAPYSSPGRVMVGEEETNALFAEEALSNLIADTRYAGDQLVVGDKINAYRKSNSPIVYVAREGGTLDRKYKELFEPYAVWNAVTKEEGFTVERIGRYTTSNTPKVRIKRPMTAAEEELAGRSYDAALKAAAFGERLEKDLAKADIFSRLREYARTNSDYAVNMGANRTHVMVQGQLMRKEDAIKYLKQRGWQHLDYSRTKEGAYKYGALRDHFVSPDAYKMLRTFETGSTFQDLKHSSAAVRAYATGIQWFKKNKTLLNIPTHMVNFVSNGFQGLLYGRNPMKDAYHGLGMMAARQLENKYRKARIAMDGSAEAEQRMFEAYRAMSSHAYYPYLRDARIARIGDSTLMTSELDYSALQDLLRDSQDPDTFGTLRKMYEVTLGRIANAWRKGNEVARHLYESEDLVYKLGGFYNDLTAGKTIDESLESIYGAYFDYGSLPPSVAFLRDTGIVPFVSYMYKALPGMLKGVHDHPERLAAVMLAAEGFNMMMARNDYGDSDAKEARELQKKIFSERRGRTVLGVPSQFYLGGGYEKDADENNKWVSKYLDVGRFLPGAGPLESMGYNKMGQNTVKELASFAIGSNPLLNVLIAASTGKDVGLDRDITEPWGKLKHAWRTFAPNWPGLGPTRATGLMWDSLVDMGLLDPSEGHTGFSRQGIAKTGSTSAAQAFLGINIARVDDEAEARSRVYEKRLIIDNLLRETRKAVKEPGLPASERRSIVAQLRTDIGEKKEELRNSQNTLQRYKELRARYQTARGGTGLPQP